MIKVAVFELQKIPGVGNAIADQLVEIGYTNRGLVATLSIGELMRIRGVGKIRARIILEGAAQEPMGREPPERHWYEPEAMDVDFVVKDVRCESVQRVGRVTLDGELDKDEVRSMQIIETVEREGGDEIALSYPYGKIFEIGQLSDETKPRDFERVLIEMLGIEEIVIDGEVYYKDGEFMQTAEMVE